MHDHEKEELIIEMRRRCYHLLKTSGSRSDDGRVTWVSGIVCVDYVPVHGLCIVLESIGWPDCIAVYDQSNNDFTNFELLLDDVMPVLRNAMILEDIADAGASDE